MLLNTAGGSGSSMGGNNNVDLSTRRRGRPPNKKIGMIFKNVRVNHICFHLDVDFCLAALSLRAFSLAAFAFASFSSNSLNLFLCIPDLCHI